jgi:hypothetical protein
MPEFLQGDPFQHLTIVGIFLGSGNFSINMVLGYFTLL